MHNVLPVVVDKLFETYGLFSDRNNGTGKVASSSSSGSLGGGSGGGSSRDERSDVSYAGLESGLGLGGGGGSQAGLRSFTLRDLMKVARRCASHSKDFNVVSGLLTDGLRCRLLSEVTDVFAASIRGRERQRGVFDDLVRALGRCWGVADCDIDGEVLHSHPQLHLNTPSDVAAVSVGAVGSERRQSTALTASTQGQGQGQGQHLVSVIGRITLVTTTTTSSSSSSLAGAAPSFLQQYAFNRHSLRMLEQLSACVSMDEPVLLVGETGSGKTSAVQELANMLHRKLIVQNLSLSTDATDLFGGFRPVSLRQVNLTLSLTLSLSLSLSVSLLPITFGGFRPVSLRQRQLAQ